MKRKINFFKKLAITSFIFTSISYSLIFALDEKPINKHITKYTVTDKVYTKNGARNAAFDDDYIDSKELPEKRVSDTKTRKTDTNGILTSNVWIQSPPGHNGYYDYQVSSQYDKRDHTNIRTMWRGVACANAGASFSIGLDHISFGRQKETRATEWRYWENTQSQQESSYRANGYILGSWNWYGMENQSNVWGAALGKKGTEVTSYAQFPPYICK